MEGKTQRKTRDGGFSSTRVAKALGLMVKLGRLIFFCLFALGVGLLVEARRARADIREKALSLGKDLAELADLVQGAHKVLLNGEPIYLSSTVSDLDKATIMERFEQDCETGAGALAEIYAKMPPEKRSEMARRAPMLSAMKLGIMRNETDDAGMVACIVQNEPRGGLPAMVERLSAVVDSGDLSRFGNLRYAFVRRLPNGKSHVLTSFTEGSFNLKRVLGLDGEAGGSDPPNVPRPPGSRRLLSASADGAPYGVQTYQTSASADEVTAYYDDAMPKLGWTKDVQDKDVYHSAVYHRQGVLLTMIALEMEAGITTVTFSEASPTNPDPSMAEEGGSTCLQHCRTEVTQCLLKTRGEDPATKKRSQEKCAEESLKCFRRCST